MTSGTRRTANAIASVCALALLLVAGPAIAEDKKANPPPLDEDAMGYREYRQHCAVCHGIYADGNGLVVPVLKVPPTNLRTLSERYGWPLPRKTIRDFIDGRPPLAHGSREMPIWGHRLAEGYPHRAPETAKRNILNVILQYLESIQSTDSHRD